MSADVVQGNYEQLQQVATRFQRQAEQVSQMEQALRRSMQKVEASWEGRGHDAFVREMSSLTMPGIARLKNALAQAHGIAHRRDVFKFYRSDSAAAVEAGNDIRTALIGFGADASHAQERTHVDSLRALGQLSVAYLLSDPVARRDRQSMGSIEGFTEQLKPEEMQVNTTPLPDPQEFLEARDG